MFVWLEKNDVFLLFISFFNLGWEFVIVYSFWFCGFSCCEKFELLYLVGNICRWIICCFVFFDDVFSLVR